VPELPDVEIQRRFLEKHAEGRRFETVEIVDAEKVLTGAAHRRGVAHRKGSHRRSGRVLLSGEAEIRDKVDRNGTITDLLPHNKQ
jgi:formamidopyrimidine-DNA glycosylase